MVRRIAEYVDNIHSKTLSATGMVSLIMVAILLLSNIEQTFNDIWGVLRGRSWYTRIVYYWTSITLGPILLVAALGFSSSSYFTSTKRFLTAAPLVGKWLVAGFLPFTMLVLALGLLYIVMPNAHVQWRAAGVGGLIGGTLLQLNNVCSMFYVSRVISYANIYGSLVSLPIFLVGLYFSWLIVLLGAQVAYTFQNRKLYLQEQLAERVNQAGREFVAVRLSTQVALRFQQGHPAPTLTELGQDLGIPIRLASQVLQTLAQAKLLVEIAGEETSFQPARPLEQITCDDLLQAMRASQGTQLPTREEDARDVVQARLSQIRQAERSSAAAVTLQDLVAQVLHPRPPSPAPPAEPPPSKRTPPSAPTRESRDGASRRTVRIFFRPWKPR